ncbi:hypothetical protein [Niallia sp. BSM11]|uniref:hypothetical protein n=1 Tax=Niallia sp. BSM11 TaxID=3391576 RepID=UPI0039849710
MYRFLTAALSVIIFGLFYAWFSYVPVANQNEDVLYFSFFDIFLFFFLIAGPIYFIAAVPTSIFLDNLLLRVTSTSKMLNYCIGIGLYSIAGAILGFFYVIIYNENNNKFVLREEYPYIVCCLAAALLYYHLSLLLTPILKKY